MGDAVLEYGRVGRLRPFRDAEGRSFMTVWLGRWHEGRPLLEKVPCGGAPLTKDEWVALDTALVVRLRKDGHPNLFTGLTPTNVWNSVLARVETAWFRYPVQPTERVG